MAAENFRQLDTAALQTQLRESDEQMFRLRFQLKMGQAEGLNKYRQLRRDRARMMGVIRQREIEGKAGK